MQQPQAQPTPKPKKKIRVPRVVNGVEQMVEIEVDADAGPGWGPNDKHTLLNHRYTRVDGPLKAAGVARYTYDQRLPGMLYARVLRCPHAHARVTSLDTDAASKIPGVKAIIQAPLTELRFAGAPVAAVAATTPEIAGDALRAIKVNYEVLRHVVHAPAAIRPDAPKVVAEENNLQEKGKNGDQQKAEAAFATADAIVEGEYISARVHHACLETHGMVVDYRGGDAATIYASTQGTFTIAADAAKELGLTESAVTVSEVWSRSRRLARVSFVEANQVAGETDVHSLRRVCDGRQSLRFVAEVESGREERRNNRCAECPAVSTRRSRAGFAGGPAVHLSHGRHVSRSLRAAHE
jgi:xanthine dehydrogenase YagR molybdenum-binding subunit